MCVCGQAICTVSFGQAKQTRECPDLIKGLGSGVCKQAGGFQPCWLSSSRPPPHTEHSVLLLESDSCNNKWWGAVRLRWPGRSPLYEQRPVCPGCWADVVLVDDYAHTHEISLTTHMLTPVHTDYKAEIAHSLTSVQKYFKKPFSHYWVTFYRKGQICVCVRLQYVCVCVRILLFHLGRENCRQLNHKRTAASTNQVRIERYFPDLQYTALIVYSSKERYKKTFFLGGTKKIKSQGERRLTGGQMWGNEKGGRIKKEQRKVWSTMRRIGKRGRWLLF